MSYPQRLSDGVPPNRAGALWTARGKSADFRFHEILRAFNARHSDM
jgi:hypothetical protein